MLKALNRSNIICDSSGGKYEKRYFNKEIKICYFNLQVKGRNKTHDLNTKPGLQFRSHTQELEHKLTEILSSLDSRSSSRDQELEFFESD